MQILKLIHHGNDLPATGNEQSSLRSHILDFGGETFVTSQPSPRLMRTHLPWHLLPFHAQRPKPKIIYVVRNARDVAVSWYHFFKSSSVFGNYTGNWEEFLDMFQQGYMVYGDYFSHVKSFWSQQKHPNLMIITYENLIARHLQVIKDIAIFCGRNLTECDVQNIAKRCSFVAMEKDVTTISDLYK
jgi:hypothetical protein